jgi:hypothetical protein
MENRLKRLCARAWGANPCRVRYLPSKQKSASPVGADYKLARYAGWGGEIMVEPRGLIHLDVEVELTGLDMAEVPIVLRDADEAECKNVRSVLPWR